MQQRLQWLLLVAPWLDQVNPGFLAFTIGCAIVAWAIDKGLEPVPAPS